MTEASKYKANIRALRVLLFSIIWGFVLITGVPVYLYVLPDLEAAWLPPIKGQVISNVRLKPDNPSYLLWDWEFYKVRRAVPEYITFMAWAPEAPEARWNVDTYSDPDCTMNMRSDRTAAPSSEPVVRHMCVKLPKELAGRDDIHVEGVIDFRMGHSFYTVPVKIPPAREDWPQTVARLNSSRSIPAPLADPK